jgi:hypothetical protein
MIYIFCIALGGLNYYLWVEIRYLKRTNRTNSNTLAEVVETIKLPEELKGYEIRATIANNQVNIRKINEKLEYVENLALRALDQVGSFIRHNKEHPPTPRAIKEFIDENGFPHEPPSKSD